VVACHRTGVGEDASKLSPARGFFREASVFTAVATIASLIHRESFLAERPLSVAVWWITYIGYCAALTWSARLASRSPGPGRPPAPGPRRLMGLYAVATTLYGVALLTIPATATAF